MLPLIMVICVEGQAKAAKEVERLNNKEIINEGTVLDKSARVWSEGLFLLLSF